MSLLSSSLDFSREEVLWARGYPRIAGVDEAGRGPLAGPVFAAACIFLAPLSLPESLLGLNDSKKLSEKERERLFAILTTTPSISYAIASVDAETIDQINILQATFLAMRRAVEALPTPPGYLLVDGNRLPKIALPAEAIIGGDALVPSISAASILAKVSRDRFMAGEAHERWPHYHFQQHKGYGTALHREALLQHGPCPLHRKSFLKNYSSHFSGE